MRSCIQSKSAAGTQSVLEHGESVYTHYLELLLAAQAGGFPDGWRTPKWWSGRVARALASLQPSESTMRNYLRYHDCGKPETLVMDESGRSHFPGHAEASANRWAALGGTEDEVWLMRTDMLLHVGSAEECQSIQGHRLMPGLLFAALSEVHANAQMFGGVESTSFKMKAKQLDRRGAALCANLGDSGGSSGTLARGIVGDPIRDVGCPLNNRGNI